MSLVVNHNLMAMNAARNLNSSYNKLSTSTRRLSSGLRVDTAADDFQTFHGVRVYSSVFLPATTKAVIMIDGAIAQPVVIYPYKEPEKIPLSNDYGVSMFYDYGTKVLTPDLVFHYENP